MIRFFLATHEHLQRMEQPAAPEGELAKAGRCNGETMVGVRGRQGGQRAVQFQIPWNGLTISVETPHGDLRFWHDPHTGESGSNLMLNDYGYILGSEAEDGEHVDVYVGQHLDAPNVYVVRQTKTPDFREYDEDKCMVGFRSLSQAKAAYLAHYNDSRFCGSIDTYSVEDFVDAVRKTKHAPGRIDPGLAKGEVVMQFTIGGKFKKAGGPSNVQHEQSQYWIGNTKKSMSFTICGQPAMEREAVKQPVFVIGMTLAKSGDR